MEITPELIQRFLAQECDPEEFEAVTRWLESSPADAPRLLGWESDQAVRPVEDHDPEEVLAHLQASLFPRKQAMVRKLLWPAAAAVILATIVGLGTVIRSRSGAEVAATEATKPRARWIERRNRGDVALIIALPDSSSVKLYGHSSIRYTDSFGLLRRESWVDGAADFVVKKDNVHPFTVTSGTLATTALGTSFGVRSGIEVRLFTGKVVVRDLSGGKDVYLLPGQRLAYDPQKRLAAVSRFNSEPAALPTEIKGLSFANSPLREVFRRLSAHYHTNIDYRAGDVAGMNFTGTMNSTDSLSGFLRLLGMMNRLEVKEGPAGFRISRQHE